MAATEYLLTGDLDAARALATTELQKLGFEVTYTDPYTATAERGSKAATFAVGAFAGKKNQHLKMGLNIYQSPEGETILRVTQGSIGMSAGLIGVKRAKEAFKEISAQVNQALTSAGVLTGVRSV